MFGIPYCKPSEETFHWAFENVFLHQALKTYFLEMKFIFASNKGMDSVESKTWFFVLAVGGWFLFFWAGQERWSSDCGTLDTSCASSLSLTTTLQGRQLFTGEGTKFRENKAKSTGPFPSRERQCGIKAQIWVLLRSPRSGSVSGRASGRGQQLGSCGVAGLLFGSILAGVSPLSSSFGINFIYQE